MKVLRRRRAKMWRKKITLLPLLKSHLWPLHDIWDSKTQCIVKLIRKKVTIALT